MSQSGFSLRPVGSDVGVALECRYTQHGAHRGSSSDRERRSLRIWVSAVAARANNFAISEATALKRTGAMTLACGGQVTKMIGGMSAGLSSSMVISEPLTRVLARVLDLDKAGSFPVKAVSRRSLLLTGPSNRVGSRPTGTARYA
jgi:hypothetical protein